ncbi:MAG: hypothetical protein A2X94_12195 [Bdellovibrionales bacterium GWB1_55_8]|nr:MAG: hypothetical protein A2X94_12195 [Bdellovibrionales bacterium GWB1_55_8]
MQIVDIRAFRGPSIYYPSAALVMQLELGELKYRDLTEFPDASSLLSKTFPLLALNPAASMGEVTEAVAVHLGAMAGLGVNSSERRSWPLPADIVAVPYFSRKGMTFVLHTAVDVVKGALAGHGYPIGQALRDINRTVQKTGLSFNSIALVQAAQERGIPWTRLPRPNLVQLGYGKNKRLIQSSWTDKTSLLATEIASQKHRGKKLLQSASVPVPLGFVVRSVPGALEAFRNIGGSVVVKPANGKQGIHVALGLTSEEEVEQAYQVASTSSEHVIVEEYLQGRDFRVLVVSGKFIAAVERVPAHVVGDGQHSVSELVEIENKNPMRGEGHTSPWCRLRLGRDELLMLQVNGKSPVDVPKDGETVFLRKSANGSAGGLASDVTDEVHPAIRSVCEKAARVIGLDICGVDIIAPDIADPGGRCWVLEVNHRPGLQPHLFPAHGKKRNVAHAIIDMLFPRDAKCDIPIVSILGGKEDYPIAEVITQALIAAGGCVGLAGLSQGFASASMMLGDTIHDAAVIHAGVPEILRHGLPYKRSDVGVLISTGNRGYGEAVRESELAIRLFVETVQEGGDIFVNRDSAELCAWIETVGRELAGKRLTFFSASEDAGLPIKLQDAVMRTLHGRTLISK